METLLKINSSDIEQLKRVISHLESENSIDWDYLSRNISGSFNEACFRSFFNEYSSKIIFLEISRNLVIKWDDYFISYYGLFLDFEELSENNSIPFTIELVMRYCEEWNWGGKTVYGIYKIGGLSHNPKFPIQINLLNYVDKLVDFKALGMNSSFIIFDPNSMPSEGWPCSLDVLKENFDVLIKY